MSKQKTKISEDDSVENENLEDQSEIDSEEVNEKDSLPVVKENNEDFFKLPAININLNKD